MDNILYVSEEDLIALNVVSLASNRSHKLVPCKPVVLIYNFQVRFSNGQISFMATFAWHDK